MLVMCSRSWKKAKGIYDQHTDKDEKLTVVCNIWDALE